MNAFNITAPCFVDHVHGLLPGHVLGRKVDGSAFQVALNLDELDAELRLELAGKRWYDAAHVLTVEQRDERERVAAEMMERS